MKIGEKIKLNYFGSDVNGIIKNVYKDNQIHLLYIQITQYASIWLPANFFKLKNG